jgi:hypothetical protein
MSTEDDAKADLQYAAGFRAGWNAATLYLSKSGFQDEDARRLAEGIAQDHAVNRMREGAIAQRDRELNWPDCY